MNNKKNEVLIIIPARGGSKRLPKKNIKNLAGKPLIYYTLEAAKKFSYGNNFTICVSTDDKEIVKVVENFGIKVPFLRPPECSDDNASTEMVLHHAIHWYKENRNLDFKIIVLLQPTSPFRTSKHISEAFKLYSDEIDMVVSVKETKSNPYLVLYEEDRCGFLKPSKSIDFCNKVGIPKVWEYNGAIYIINVESLMSKRRIKDFNKVVKFVMTEFESIDIDTEVDFLLAQIVLNQDISTV